MQKINIGIDQLPILQPSTGAYPELAFKGMNFQGPYLGDMGQL